MEETGYENTEWGHIETGQVWIPDDSTDFTLEIISVSDSGDVEVKEVNHECNCNGKCHCGTTYFHEIGGPDGFCDFLYWNNYHLKK